MRAEKKKIRGMEGSWVLVGFRKKLRWEIAGRASLSVRIILAEVIIARLIGSDVMLPTPPIRDHRDNCTIPLLIPITAN